MENKNLEVIRNEALMSIQSEGESLADRANSFIIINDKTLQEANELFQICKAFIETIHKHLDPIRESAYATWKKQIAEIDRREKPFITVQKIIKPKMIAYKQKVQEEIRKKEEEAQAKIDADRKEAEALLEKAADQEKAGDLEKADETFEKAEAQEEVVKEETLKMKEIPKAPETKGTTMRKIPKWKVINETQIPLEYMIIDSVKIGRVVRATKGEIKIPGIEVYFETV